MNKKDIYSAYGIEYKAGKIRHPEYGFINPLLVDGNSKLGKGVWTWSMLPGTDIYDLDGKAVKGTCCCDCSGCYAKTGFYRMYSVERSNAIKTYTARVYTDFMKNAIIAQIHADGIRLVRIHASGDFFDDAYIAAWKDIVNACSDCVFWTYTKNKAAESAFDGIANINIVKSCVPGFGFNFGHCDYIIKLYHALKDGGKPVYICRCGIDPNQHCINCKGCSNNEYVLFLEHSTNYKASDDPLFTEVVKLVNAQTER